MLAGGTDGLYRQALAAPHEPYSRIEVWSGDGVQLENDLTFTGASVSASLTSRVARSLTVQTTYDMYPDLETDLLAPFGNELRAWHGIRFAEGTEYVWQVFRGRIVDARRNEDGNVEILADDRAADVESARFETPQNSVAGALVTDEFQRLITDALPDAQFGDSDSFYQRMPIETWEHDRAGALDEMATAVGAFWYPLADGRFVIRRYPWTVRRDPVVTYADGEGGVVVGASSARSRDGLYNSVTVTGERTDGTTPVWYTARDTNPTSPTRVDGPFGRRNLLRQLQTPTTQEAAAGAARDLLRRATAFTETWEWEISPDAALELGDPVQLDVWGRTGIIQVVASFMLRLGIAGTMRVRGRAQVYDATEAGV